MICCATILTLAACNPSDPDFGIRLEALSLDAAGEQLRVSARQSIDLSSEARRALRAGVPLRFRIDASLRPRGQWRAGVSESMVFELRYLPLSQRYQLSWPETERQATSYRRLRHALAAIRDVEFTIALEDEARGPLTLRMRSRLDQAALPGPMQLPVLLSADWAHDSGWLSQDLELDG